jgi:hypothetical protein
MLGSRGQCRGRFSELGEEGAFGPDEIRILVAAFDAAWEAVKASGRL